MGICVLLAVMTSLCGTIYSSTSLVSYSVIIDAGSTSSKLKIYQWSTRTSSLTFLNVSEIYYQKFTPGLDHFVGNLGDIPNYIKPMISNATCRVPFSKQRDTPIYLLATAGLRLLADDFAVDLLDSLRLYLMDTSHNPFTYLPRSVRILSGEEEGVFAWISANYHLGFFSSNRPVSKAVGILEMGGGSTQITFHPDGPILANMFSLRVAGKIYDLYSHSYLYYGQNYMKQRIVDSLLDDVSNNINNPCSLKDDIEIIETIEKSREVFVRGSGNPTQCLTLIQSFLQSAQDEMCYPKPCTIGNVYQPSVGTDTFYAISAFRYSPKSLRAFDASWRLDIEKLNITAYEYCQMNMTQATNNYDVEKKYASEYCMMALYIPSLLTSAYGFPKNTTNIYIKDSVNGHSVDWGLGAVIYETEIREDDYPCVLLSSSSKISPSLWRLVIWIFIITLLRATYCGDML